MQDTDHYSDKLAKAIWEKMKTRSEVYKVSIVSEIREGDNSPHR